MQAAWLFQKSIWALNLLGSAFVVWRLYSLQLHSVYRYFFIGVALSVARSSALFPFSPTDHIYFTIWSWTQPLLWLSYILIVIELFSLVLREYQGIYSLGRWFFFGAVFISVLVSGLTVLPTIPSTSMAGGRPLSLYYYSFIERGLTTSLAIFLLLLLLVLVAWFPVPLSRNLKIHCTVYSAYFFANNVIFLYWHAGNSMSATYISTVAKLFVAVICYACWGFYLTRAGESRTASLGLSRDVVKEKGLLGQLENLNATLLGAARK